MKWLLFSFTGRITREQWWGGIILALLGIFPFFLLVSEFLVSGGEGLNPLVAWVLFGLFLVGNWAGLALNAKRLHDQNLSGWWQLLILIPLLGALGMYIFQGFVAGDAGANRFGARRKSTEASQV